jgi:RHS repeat-associated protein
MRTTPEQGTIATCYLALNGKYLAKIVREGSNPSQTYFLHADMVGSIRTMTDSAGQVVARFDYEPFGLLTISAGPMAAGAHRFTGKPEDGDTELYYFGARYYDPEVGRFISRDPSCYGLNWYSYCSLSPAVAGASVHCLSDF